jgi:hypothetical protein
MKQCPTCHTTYTDDSLRFCLADGSSLDPLPDNEATLVKPMRSAAENQAAGTMAAQPSTAKIVVVIGLVALFLLIGTGIALALLYSNRDSRKANVPATPASVATPVATPDLEKQNLQDQLANIQKQLDAQKASNKNTGAPSAATTPAVDATGYVSARVNSPNDGFLALRDKPHAEFGNRIERIPHGAVVTIENCGATQRRLGGRSGRWCMVTYNGKTGYVFDAFLIRQ